MARYGFAGDMPDTKNLVLFVLRHVPGFVTMPELSEMVMLDDNFNYFIFADSVEEMIESGHLARDAEGRIAVTPRGIAVGKTVESSLALSLRRVAVQAAEAVAERIKRSSAITAEIVENGGEYYVKCVLTDGIAPLAELSLYAGSEKQAVFLAQGWRKNAEKIYGSLLESFANGEEKSGYSDS